MRLSTRCVRCGHRLWFWQRRGWYVVAPGRFLEWHTRCATSRRVEFDPEALRALGEDILAVIEEER